MTVEQRTVGRTTFERRELDAGTIESQPALVASLRASADPDLVLDVRLIGVRRDELDIEPAEVEDALRCGFLRVRVRDLSRPALGEGALPPAETIVGRLHPQRRGPHRVPGGPGGRTAAADDRREADELRDVLRLGRLLLAGQDVTL